MKEELGRIEQKIDKINLKLDTLNERSIRTEERSKTNSGSIKIIGSTFIALIVGIGTYLIKMLIGK